MNWQTKGHVGGNPMASENSQRSNNNTKLYPLESVTGLEYVESTGASGGRYGYALQASRIDLLGLPCSCFSNGTCPVCRAWAVTMTLNAERRATYGRP